jgi:hypothetical protein
MDNTTDTQVDAAVAKTLAAVDSGVVQNIVVDATVITLPAAAAGLVGMVARVRVKGAKASASGPAGIGSNKTVGFTVAPAAADGISGGGLATPVVNKGFTYAKATSRIGDYLELQCSGVTGVTAWFVRSSRGTFTRVP